MNKELLELLESINDKKAEVKNLVAENKLDEAKKAKDELKEMQDKFDLLKDLDDGKTEEAKAKAGNKVLKPADKNGVVKEFANAARRRFKAQNSMNEGTPSEGGYTVPEDIETRINERRTAKFSMIDLVSVKPVKTNKGSETYKKRANQTGFQKVGEGGKIGAKTTPQFERVSYEIDKYGGYFPVTNELLEDSDDEIATTLINWIGDDSRVTRNTII